MATLRLPGSFQHSPRARWIFKDVKAVVPMRDVGADLSQLHTQVSAMWWGLKGVCIGGMGDIKEESDYRKEEKEKGKESY